MYINSFLVPTLQQPVYGTGTMDMLPPIYGQRCFPLYINEYYSITKIAILSDIHNIYCKKWKISNLDK